MSQYSVGNVALTKDSGRIVAAAGVDWSKVPINAFFIRSGQGGCYQVASLTAPAQSASGRWEAMIYGVYAGATEAAAPYVMHVSFTPRGAPILTPGDTETAALFNRLALLVEGGGVIGGGGLATVDTEVVFNPQNNLTFPVSGRTYLVTLSWDSALGHFGLLGPKVKKPLPSKPSAWVGEDSRCGPNYITWEVYVPTAATYAAIPMFATALALGAWSNPANASPACSWSAPVQIT